MVKQTNKTVPIVRRKGLFRVERAFLKSPVDFLADCQKIYGNTFVVHLFRRKLYVTSDPESMKYVLQTNNKNYIKDAGSRQLKLALGNGLLMNEGESWMRQRRLAQPAFYKKRLDGLFDVMVDVVEDFCNKMEQHRGNPNPINITSEMNTVTADVVMKTLLGTDLDIDSEDVQETILSAQNYIIKRIRQPYMRPVMYLDGRARKFKTDLDRFDKIIYDAIDERQKTGEMGNNLLSMLIETKDADTGAGMNRQQLRDEVMTMYVAGHETSANALSWTWYLLTKHPDVYKKVKTEVQEVLGNRRPELADLKAMQYTRQVMEESMRCYPPAWATGREALTTDHIQGYQVEKGELVFLSINNLHHDPELWENPDEFNPDRFSPEQVKARSKGHYIPFGAGPRMCIGNHFALMEIQLLLACMIRKFDFERDEKHLVQREALVTLRPKYGVKVWVK